LICSAEHTFDGWFKDSASFDKQAKRGLLECPTCGTTKVKRALMTPAVPKKGRSRSKPSAMPKTGTPDVGAPVAVATDKLPDHVRAMLQKLRTEIEKNCDYVGEDFAEEARRIHRGESDSRGIYGEASADDAEALAEEGIEIAKIPWIPRADG
jgi:hypothetical protein